MLACRTLAATQHSRTVHSPRNRTGRGHGRGDLTHGRANEVGEGKPCQSPLRSPQRTPRDVLRGSQSPPRSTGTNPRNLGRVHLWLMGCSIPAGWGYPSDRRHRSPHSRIARSRCGLSGGRFRRARTRLSRPGHLSIKRLARHRFRQLSVNRCESTARSNSGGRRQRNERCRCSNSIASPLKHFASIGFTHGDGVVAHVLEAMALQSTDTGSHSGEDTGSNG